MTTTRSESSLELVPKSEVSFRQLSKWHPQHQGIYMKDGTARSIMFDPSETSPYPDRWIEPGRILDYTGQGKAELSDQTWNRYNLGMRRAMEEGRKVQVFERLRTSPARYLYHGLWTILGFREVLAGPTGRRVFRFLLSSDAVDARPVIPIPIAASTNVASDIAEPPARLLAATHRIIRDTRLAAHLKRAYGFRCQLCGDARRHGDGDYYAEAHHIRPLGRPHDGPDAKSNLIVLCPNHHADFDFGAVAIDPLDGKTIMHKFDRSLNGKRAHFLSSHSLQREHLDYHVSRFFLDARTSSDPDAGRKNRDERA